MSDSIKKDVIYPFTISIRLWFFILAFTILGSGISGCIGKWETEEKLVHLKADAVKFGYAYWKTTDEGVSTFKWIHEKRDEDNARTNSQQNTRHRNY